MTDMSATAKVYGMDGSSKGSADLPADLFAQPVNEHLLWMSVQKYEPYYYFQKNQL